MVLRTVALQKRRTENFGVDRQVIERRHCEQDGPKSLYFLLKKQSDRKLCTILLDESSLHHSSLHCKQDAPPLQCNKPHAQAHRQVAEDLRGSRNGLEPERSADGHCCRAGPAPVLTQQPSARAPLALSSASLREARSASGTRAWWHTQQNKSTAPSDWTAMLLPAKAAICDSLRAGPLTVVVANTSSRSLAAVSNHLMGASSKVQWLYWKTGQPCAAKCSRAQSTRLCFSP